MELAMPESEPDQARASAARPEADHGKRMAGEASLKDGQKGAAPKDSQDAAGPRHTGGLSALVNLWNTAATMRPFRRKETEGKPPDPVFGVEVIRDDAPSSSGPAPVPKVEGQLKSDRPAQGGRARPSSPPRRPEPKPAAAPDDTKELGGWLRGLGKRIRGKE
jgi:hypothetical protein